MLRLIRRRPARPAAAQESVYRAQLVDPRTLCGHLDCDRLWTAEVGPDKWRVCEDHDPRQRKCTPTNV